MKKEKQSKWNWKWFLNGSMIAALVAAVAVFMVMLQMEKNLLTQYERGMIYVASVEIPEGQLITEDNYMEYFEEMSLDKSCIPESALYDISQVQGLVAGQDIERGVLLTEGMFEQMNHVLEGMSEPVIAGLKAEDLYQVVGGILRSGDRIHIYSVEEDNTAKLVWENVFVENVFDQSGRSIANSDEETAVQRMNVYLDKGDVSRFYEELAAGSLRVVKVY